VCHPNAIDLPSYNKTILVMEEGSSLGIKGNLFIASGTTIIIRKNAKMIFHGNNYIGHNNLLIAHDHFEMGENTSTSWNVTLMEDDGHDLYYATGKIFPKRRSPLILSKNVGIQIAELDKLRNKFIFSKKQPHHLTHYTAAVTGEG